MKKKVFIHTNNKQIFGAKIARYAIERALKNNETLLVEILNVDELEIFKNFHGVSYKRGGKIVAHNPYDLQSFTLARFMPPERMNYEGRAIVIDPDVFACINIDELLSLDLAGAAIACCRKKDAWDTSVMLMDCTKLRHWNVTSILKHLKMRVVDYNDLITLRAENNIKELSRAWNSLDILNSETKLLHTTNRLTQPWKTGLPIDFTIHGKKWYWRLLGRYPKYYQPHQNKDIESFFFKLVREALHTGIISRPDIYQEIEKGNIRPDILDKME